MVRAIERIERDIAGIKEAIRAIALELQSAYSNYITTLGQAIGKQLVLASYHLCTQGYPESFLNLSLNQRQKLQHSIRQLAKQTAERLLVYARRQEIETADVVDDQVHDEIDDELNNIQNNSPSVDSSNPMELAQWQQELEEVIQETLKKVSHNANVIFQKTGVLPKKLPEPILAAAAAVSESSSEIIPGPPNLLNLIIEIENDEESANSKVTHIMAINLRLGEIEFADSTLLSQRKQIRNILIQFGKLGREYQKKHQELTIAEAEAAWRASWFEE